MGQRESKGVHYGEKEQKPKGLIPKRTKSEQYKAEFRLKLGELTKTQPSVTKRSCQPSNGVDKIGFDSSRVEQHKDQINIEN